MLTLLGTLVRESVSNEETELTGSSANAGSFHGARQPPRPRGASLRGFGESALVFKH